MGHVSIFYDLETSALERVGQIMNFCFVAVDKEWNELEVLKASVKLSRLQLPDPAAIGATKIDVFQHQESSVMNECQAAFAIQEFIARWARSNRDKIPLIGYNSEDFDLKYLRTVWVRNGVFPYFSYRGLDAFLATQFLFATHQNFRSEILRQHKEREATKLSLKLAEVTACFGLLQGDQAHESEFDVRLLIELARLYQSKFNLDVRTFRPYQLGDFHKPSKQTVMVSRFSRSLEKFSHQKPLVYLREDSSASLWVNLDKFIDLKKKGEPLFGAVSRCKHDGDLYWFEPGTPADPSYQAVAVEAYGLLKDVTLDQIYGPRAVYIEQFIYNLGIRQIQALCDCLAGKVQSSVLSTPDQKVLFRRFLIENASTLNSQDLQQSFNQYCAFRYGGKMVLYEEDEGRKPKGRGAQHLTLQQMQDLLRESAQNATDERLRGAYDSLRKYYQTSEVWRVLQG